MTWSCQDINSYTWVQYDGLDIGLLEDEFICLGATRHYIMSMSAMGHDAQSVVRILSVSSHVGCSTTTF